MLLLFEDLFPVLYKQQFEDLYYKYVPISVLILRLQ